MKSKAVKLPLELVELIEKRDPDRPPGDVLFGIVKDYIDLEDYAKTKEIVINDKESLSNVIKKAYEGKVEYADKLIKRIDDLGKVIEGLDIFNKIFFK